MRLTTSSLGRPIPSVRPSQWRGRVVVALLLIFALVAGVGGGVAEAQERRGHGFERWPVITIDGEDHLWEGAPDGPSGETDVPGLRLARRETVNSLVQPVDTERADVGFDTAVGTQEREGRL